MQQGPEGGRQALAWVREATLLLLGPDSPLLILGPPSAPTHLTGQRPGGVWPWEAGAQWHWGGQASLSGHGPPDQSPWWPRGLLHWVQRRPHAPLEKFWPRLLYQLPHPCFPDLCPGAILGQLHRRALGVSLGLRRFFLFLALHGVPGWGPSAPHSHVPPTSLNPPQAATKLVPNIAWPQPSGPY